MEVKITFENMGHSAPLESHTREKVAKITDFIAQAEDLTPFHIQVWLKAHKLHAHHRVEIQLKTPRFELQAHEEGNDLYAVLDMAIDKIVAQLNKAKKKAKDKEKKPETDKTKFESEDDKYTLS